MQALLALDGIVCPPEFETARKKRREAVKFTQELIDRVDAMRETLNATAKGVSNMGRITKKGEGSDGCG